MKITVCKETKNDTIIQPIYKSSISNFLNFLCAVLQVWFINVIIVFCQVSRFSLFRVPGLLQADTGVIRDGKQVFRLFCHESMRVFHDRLINNEDKKYFHTMLAEMASKHFGEVGSWNCVFFSPLLYYRLCKTNTHSA